MEANEPKRAHPMCCTSRALVVAALGVLTDTGPKEQANWVLRPAHGSSVVSPVSFDLAVDIGHLAADELRKSIAERSGSWLLYLQFRLLLSFGKQTSPPSEENGESSFPLLAGKIDLRPLVRDRQVEATTLLRDSSRGAIFSVKSSPIQLWVLEGLGQCGPSSAASSDAALIKLISGHNFTSLSIQGCYRPLVKKNRKKAAAPFPAFTFSTFHAHE